MHIRMLFSKKEVIGLQQWRQEVVGLRLYVEIELPFIYIYIYTYIHTYMHMYMYVADG